MHRSFVLAATALLPLAGAAQAQQSTPGTPAATSRDGAVAAAPVAAFIAEAARDSLAEVRLGELAQRNGSSSSVKTYGQRMVMDHTQATQKLTELARAKQIVLPTDLGPQHQAVYDRLSKLQGSAFDQAYAQAMLEDHAKAVREFSAQSQAGTDSDVAAWARDTLPILQQHLQIAQQLPGRS